LDGYNSMPSYRYVFREAELDDLMAYLKTLNAKPVLPAAPAPGDDVSLGRDLFRAHCGRCHGSDSGESKTGGTLKGLFSKEKLSSGEAVSEKNVIALLEDGHGGMSSTARYLDRGSLKAVLAFVRSL
jgi:mono/diheme cytochrome c family protein